MTFAEQCAELQKSAQHTQKLVETLREFLMKQEEPDFDLDAWLEEQHAKKFYEKQTGQS